MAKYSEELKESICSLILRDSYTVAEICEAVGITKDTYYRWLKEKSDFSDAIKKAREDADADRLVECRNSIVKLINGYDYEETKTVLIDDGTGEGKAKIKERIVTTKHIAPSLGAIIHFQTNKAPDEWKNRHSGEFTGANGKDLFPCFDTSKFTTEQLKQWEKLMSIAQNE